MKCCGRENCRVVPSYDDLRARFSGNGVTARGRDGICPIDEAQVNRSALAFREHRARLNADFDGQERTFQLIIPAQAGLRRQDARPNIRAANGPESTPQQRRVLHLDLDLMWQKQNGFRLSPE
jgi:hypothetical protein